MRKPVPILLMAVLIFTSVSAQTWQYEAGKNAWFLQHNLYNDFQGIMRMPDSTVFVFTRHLPPVYWKNRKRDTSRLYVTTINKQGAITSTKEIEFYYASRSVRKQVNGKFYVLGCSNYETPTGKHTNTYPLFVYGSNWQLEKKLFLPEFTNENQQEYTDFEVDEENNIYLITKTYNTKINNKSLLVKYNSAGGLVKKISFDPAKLDGLRLVKDSLHLTVTSTRYPYLIDSIYTLRLDKNLNFIVHNAFGRSRQNRFSKKAFNLTSGNQIIFIDSMFNTGAYDTSVRKIAFTDQYGSRTWTYVPPARNWVGHDIHELQNGKFLVGVWKKYVRERLYDTVCIVQFDTNGNQKTIKSVLNGANPSMEHDYTIVHYFEARKNELWIFIERRFPNLQERIYFERLYLTD